MKSSWEEAQKGFQTPHVAGFWVDGHDQICPHAIIERFEILQKKFQKEIGTMAQRGYMFVGPIGAPKDIKSAFVVSAEKRNKILEFHALQRAVQVLKNRSSTDKEFKRGLTNNNSLNIVSFDSYSYKLHDGWVHTQLREREAFMKKYADEIATIREHFDIEIKEVVQEGRGDYSAGGSEQVCYYTWYGVFLKPKKAIKNDTDFGGGDLQTNLENAWEKLQEAFEKIGVKMPDAPKAAKQKERPVVEEPVKVPVQKEKEVHKPQYEKQYA